MSQFSNAENGPGPSSVSSPSSPNSSSDASNSKSLKVKKNKPKASRLRQQKLPAWQPILNASTVIPMILGVGIVFVPLGIMLFLASNGVKEFDFVYSNYCNQTIKTSPEDFTDGAKPNGCTISFNLTERYEGDVYFYYRLENYFQNHRRYLKSRSDRQLLGQDLTAVDDCQPYDKANGPKGNVVYAPCGAIANSMFNDSFTLKRKSGPLVSDLEEVPLTYKGVVWEIDRDTKFRNPPHNNYQELVAAFSNTTKPRHWQKPIYELDRFNDDNNGFQNVDFIVWMRSSALPDFRKLYRLLNTTSNSHYADGLPAGTYFLHVENNYPVYAFNGRKHFIVSTTSWAGGKNTFLGITYIVVGTLCVILGLIFLVIHLNFGNSLRELANIQESAN